MQVNRRTRATRITARLLGCALLAAVPALSGTATAHAATYSTSLSVLQQQCLALGERTSAADAGLGSFEIPSTQVSYGSTGVCVALVQTLLDDGAYVCTGSNYLAVDGQDGPATTKAVKCIQSWDKIQVDGQVGPETWSRIWWVN
ncbi:putative peptidoglycan binding protein [Streptomyces sp. 846.5]|nr:peptidoglycan-binding protein [Streptomyces sp. 846.5]TDT97543.1 putative peptidoglycan binding protein [Streptomyces sp. 846.5]